MKDAPIGEDDLQAFVDARLDDPRRAAVEAYLAEHPDVAERVAAERRQRDMLRDLLQPKFDEPIPAHLRIDTLAAARRERRRGRWQTAAAACVMFVVGAGSGWFAAMETQPTAKPKPMPMAVADEATLAYSTFASEVMHPVEVRADDQAHLMTWLSKRLGHTMSAPDLSGYGFRLMGGRLLPGGSGAAAQLMYDDDHGNRLTLYVETAHGDATAFRFAQDRDMATFVWIDKGMGFAVTAKASRETLLPIAEAVYRQLDTAPPPARGS